MQGRGIHAHLLRTAASLTRCASRLGPNNAPVTLRTFSLQSRLSYLLFSRATFSSTSFRGAAITSHPAKARGACDPPVAPSNGDGHRPGGIDPADQDDPKAELEGFAAKFFSRPLPERLAAITVARFTAPPTEGEEKEEKGAGGGISSQRPAPAAMPLELFHEKIPTVTREAIQQSFGEPAQWIERTALLEVVYKAADAEAEGGPSPAPLVGTPRALVRVRNGEVLAVLKATKGQKGVGAPPVTPDERHQALRTTLDAFLRREHGRTQRRYCFLRDAYQGVMRGAAAESSDSMPQIPLGPALHHIASSLRYDEFESLVQEGGALENYFWVHSQRLITWRDSDESAAPRFEIPRSGQAKACLENNYCGWGSPCSVPTREDVAEVLKYIPVNWGNMGNLAIPPAIKKARIRSSSPLQWFRRQPYYFEVRDMAGTIEIRRSVLLHPEAHGMTLEEAFEQVHLAITTREANNLVPLGADGRPLQEDMSAAEKAIRKFFYRVCPSYFAPLSLVMQRYTKKNLTEEILLEMARRFKDEFEVYVPRHAGVPLVRKRAGVDSSRWGKDFVEDLEKYPEDVHGIISIMNRLCPTWDRPEYVYVRLSPTEQQRVRGYNGMMQILQRHPGIFRVGKRFVRRMDSSDPLAQVVEEPSVDDMTSRTYLREENPYLSPLDNAKVFHYVMPRDKPCSLDFFVECASPAMRVALPPRIATIIQQFPRLFACRETSPGVYSVHKINAPTTSSPNREDEPEDLYKSPRSGGIANRDAKLTDDPIVKTTTGGGSQCDDKIQEGDSSWLLESEIAAEADLSRTDVVEAVKDLIPPNGVECANLLFWASMSVQRAANHHYGGLIKMVEAEKKHFRVVDSADSKMIYCA